MVQLTEVYIYIYIYIFHCASLEPLHMKSDAGIEFLVGFNIELHAVCRNRHQFESQTGPCRRDSF